MKLGQLDVRFRHDVNKGITECSIELTDGFRLGTRARVGKNDSYNRETGRKLSLLRGMQSAKIPRNQRYAVWNDYRLLSPNPKWPESILDNRKIVLEKKRAKKKAKSLQSLSEKGASKLQDDLF